MSNTKEKNQFYRDNQISLKVNDSTTSTISFQSGILQLTRSDAVDKAEPETHNLIDLDTPEKVRLVTGANIRWFYNKEMLYMRFCDFAEDGGCFAITHGSKLPLVAHLPKAMYDTLAHQHDAAVDKEQSDTASREGLNKELQSAKEQCGRMKSTRHDYELQIRRRTAYHQSEVDELKTSHKEELTKLKEEITNERILMEQAESLRKPFMISHERSLKKLSDDIHRNKLSTLRDSKFADFTIACNDGKKLRAHKNVLSSFWPFFEKMMENSCKETEEDELTLDHPSETVELMLSDLYGCKIEFTHIQAFPLVQLAGMYQLPELSQMAFKKIKHSEKKLKLSECIEGWRRARMGGHDEARDFFSKLIVAKSKGKKRAREEFEAMDKEETLELFLDSMAK